MVADKNDKDLILGSNSKKIVVLACPGSGKTTTLTQKIMRLHENGISLKNILAITFTRKAAEEMRTRIDVEDSDKKNICTFHSLGSRILYKYKKKVGLKNNYRGASTEEKESIAKEIIILDKDNDDVIYEFLKYVSSKKNCSNYLNKFNFTEDQFVEYTNKMIENNLIDLDDLIYLPIQILEKNEEIRNNARKDYKYIFVDEYQDINEIQERFLNLLIEDGKTNVMFVGDDDQSIYEFRGSSPKYLLDKAANNSGYDVYYLTNNYRSQKPIVELSKVILDGFLCGERINKEINAEKDTSTIKPIKKGPFLKQKDEIDYVVNEICRLIDNSIVEPKEIAVLCRYSSKKNSSHEELNKIKNALADRGIAATTSKDDYDKPTQETIKKLWKLMIVFNSDEIAPEDCNLIETSYYEKHYLESLDVINEIFNFSKARKFGDTIDEINKSKFIDKIDKYISSNDIDSTLKEKLKLTHDRLKKISEIYSFLKEQFNLVHNGEYASTVFENLRTYFKNHNSPLKFKRDSEIYDSIYDVIKGTENNSSDKYDYALIVNASMNEFIGAPGIDMDTNCVKLLTAHQSKGLQFDVVFVIGLEVGSFPSFQSVFNKEEEIDNERRLFYVCVTRARELLYLTSSIPSKQEDYMFDMENKKYSFISTLPPECYCTDDIKSFNMINFTIHDSKFLKELEERDQRYYDQLIYNETLENKLKKTEAEKSLLKNEIKVKEKANDEKITLLAEANNEKDKKIKDLSLNSQEMEEKLAKTKIDKNTLENKLKKSEAEKSLLENEIKVKEKANDEKITLLVEAINEKDKKIKDLSSQIEYLNNQPNSQEVEEELEKPEDAYDKREKRNLNDAYNLIMRIEEIPQNIKTIIKKQYKIFVTDKRYSKFKNNFEEGIEVYLSHIIATIKYLKNKISRDEFEKIIRVKNNKGKLDIIVRAIMAHLTNFKKATDEFGIAKFLQIYLKLLDGEKIDDQIYKDAAIEFRNKIKNNNIKDLSRELAENMYIMSTITANSTHGNDSDNSRYVVKKSVEVLNNFLNDRGHRYYKVFSSFFLFIDLYAVDDIMIFINK